MIDLADHLGLAEVDLVAHSAGTRWALATAVQYPDRVRSLALVCPPATWLTGTASDSDVIVGMRNDPKVSAAWASMAREPANESEFERARSREDPAGYAHWTERERAHARLGRMSLAAIRDWFTAVPRDAAQQILAATVPRTLVVGGQGDILSGVRPVGEYADALGADIAWIADCGHYPWIEQPERFRDVVGGWLRDSARS